MVITVGHTETVRVDFRGMQGKGLGMGNGWSATTPTSFGCAGAGRKCISFVIVLAGRMCQEASVWVIRVCESGN